MGVLVKTVHAANAAEKDVSTEVLKEAPELQEHSASQHWKASQRHDMLRRTKSKFQVSEKLLNQTFTRKPSRGMGEPGQLGSRCSTKNTG
jgi:hypothetical protein